MTSIYHTLVMYSISLANVPDIPLENALFGNLVKTSNLCIQRLQVEMLWRKF